MNVLLKLSDLGSPSDLCLDQLLDVLRQVPDGFTTRRMTGYEPGEPEPRDLRWTLEAEGYGIGVQPDMQCGFLEEGDGKVLTAITGRIGETKGNLTLSSTLVERPVLHGTPWVEVEWRVSIHLGVFLPNWDENPRAGEMGLGAASNPGTAALIAYLKAWGVVE